MKRFGWCESLAQEDFKDNNNIEIASNVCPIKTIVSLIIHFF